MRWADRLALDFGRLGAADDVFGAVLLCHDLAYADADAGAQGLAGSAREIAQPALVGQREGSGLTGRSRITR